MRYISIKIWVLWHLHPSTNYMEDPFLFKSGCPMYKSGRKAGDEVQSVECLPTVHAALAGFHPQYHIH